MRDRWQHRSPRLHHTDVLLLCSCLLVGSYAGREQAVASAPRKLLNGKLAGNDHCFAEGWSRAGAQLVSRRPTVHQALTAEL